MASQDARLSKFEADFKQQQSEMPNKIDTFLKAINDRMTGALPSDTVKNPKLNVNPTSSISTTRSYQWKIPKVLPILSIRSMLLKQEIENVLVYPVGIVRNIEVYAGKLQLLEDFYVIDMEKDHMFPLLVERGFLATASSIIDCKKANITIGEGFTRSIFRVKEIGLGYVDTPYWTTIATRKTYKSRPSTNDIGAQPLYYLEKDFMDYHLPMEWEIARDVELNPFKDVLMFKKWWNS
ncbi:hypothetical protein Tco_1252819 [Tanacetum coccineum]